MSGTRNNLTILILQVSFVFGLVFAWAYPAMARMGSNLGEYGTNFSPAVLTGQVTGQGGIPVSGVAVYTIAGHYTTTDSDGSYYLRLDSPGIYAVTAAKDAGLVSQEVEVFLGSTTTLNLVLSGCMIGNANGDGRVDILDAIRVLRMVLRLEQPPQDLCPVDPDGSNTIDILDVAQIMIKSL